MRHGLRGSGDLGRLACLVRGKMYVLGLRALPASVGEERKLDFNVRSWLSAAFEEVSRAKASSVTGNYTLRMSASGLSVFAT